MANVLAILVVGAAVFFAAGFVSRAEIGSFRGLLRRFASTLVGLVLIGGLLTVYLVRLVDSVRTERAIKSVLDERLADEPNTTLSELQFAREEAEVSIIASIDSPRVIAPDSVAEMERLLEERLGDPVRLFVRSNVTKSVTATGSTSIRPYLSLDGKIAEVPLSPAMRLLQQAEQVTREVMVNLPHMRFEDIQLVELASRPVLLISVQSPRQITTEQVARFQAHLQERLGAPDLRVDVRRTNTTDLTAKGPILLGEAHFGVLSTEQEQERSAAEATLRGRIEAHPDFFVMALDAVRRDDHWEVRAEVVGPRLLTPDEVRDTESRSAANLGGPVRLTVWGRTELQVRSAGYQALGTPEENP
jgi:hypothetical protein